MIVGNLTPELLISAPRRGPAVPNPDGTLALYTESAYTSGKARKGFHTLDVTTGVSSLILSDDEAYEPGWLGDGTNTIIYLRNGRMGVTFVLTMDVDRVPPEPSLAGYIRAPVQCLKTKGLSDGTVAFTVLGYADTHGKLLNTDTIGTRGARVYSSSLLRHGDLQMPPYTYTIWYSVLSKQDGTWSIADDLHNALGGTDLHIPHMMGRYGDLKNQYDLCESGIVVAVDTTDPCGPAGRDASNVYLINIDSFSTGACEAPREIKALMQGDDSPGIYAMPQFSPDGSMIGFLRTEGSNHERSHIYIYLTMQSQRAISVFSMVTGKPWPLAPTGFRFSADGHSLYITANDCGQVGLYHLDLQPNAYPRPLLRNGTVSACYPLGRSDVNGALVTSSTFVDSCLYQVVSHDPCSEPAMLSSSSNHGAKLGLSPTQVSEIYFEGAGNYTVHAWIMKPRHFDTTKKLPVAILVHGGTPNNAWLNAWDMKWNAAAFAEQGYVVVLPNITGSTGYGQDFATGIYGDWGGRPYDDLVNCLHTLRNIPGIDVDNAIIAGAGYGGYLMNWIQGRPLARRFKAMVCHAGIFSTRSLALRSNPPPSGISLNSLELYNPAHPNLLRNWKTPMLVIHNEKDTVSPIGEGLATYNNLQSLKVPSQFLTFTDESHEIVKEENSLEWYRSVFAWINRFTGVASGQRHADDAPTEFSSS
ncbi:putative prolyl oligopeptidase [Rosellinia necatrix]|uniref:Dipeptidyl-peptidase V n=1 Tax=Rosellinia necatrix TaxID=77044 RepID=A0A1W2TVW6_ROSNE|nr:putative prolyl oligopeptidase [Rosellinia necatrix]